MGQAKRKLNQRQKFLLQHPRCAYCGGPATTTDHCPPRCFFVRREWPESYEFPACVDCNSAGRLDEQGLAVLVRPGLNTIQEESERQEWEKLLKEVGNNQPALVSEWQSVSEIVQRRSFRKAFGPRGDELRHGGWGALHLGPLSHAMTERFMIKMAQALYYRHNNTPFEGMIYARHISLLNRDIEPDFYKNLIHIAPMRSISKRGKNILNDQFVYAFNHNEEHGIIYAVVQFSEQFIFQLIAMRSGLSETMEATAREKGTIILDEFRHQIKLKGP